jgi:hypothetical protein
MGKGIGGEYWCKKMSTHVCKCKKKGMGEGEDKGDWWNGRIYICYIVRTCVKAIMYPTQHNNRGKKFFKN